MHAFISNVYSIEFLPNEINLNSNLSSSNLFIISLMFLCFKFGNRCCSHEHKNKKDKKTLNLVSKFPFLRQFKVSTKNIQINYSSRTKGRAKKKKSEHPTAICIMGERNISAPCLGTIETRSNTIKLKEMLIQVPKSLEGTG